MKAFDWSSGANILEGFGGDPVVLHVPRTGLPFFDALRLYGAIDLYVGLREDVDIRDKGNGWEISGKSRASRIAGKDLAAFKQVWGKKKTAAEPYCADLRSAILDSRSFQEMHYAPATKALKGLDAVLQAGVRDVAAATYETLQTGQTSESTCCVAKIALSDGLLAFVGKKRIEGMGNILFLPVFEGTIDLSKVVSPLRAWISIPNALCAQVLVLLALKTSLFAEGYQDRLTAVVFNTFLGGRRSDNYSGVIAIGSTAIGKLHSSAFVSHIYRTFRGLLISAWKKQGKNYQATKLTPDALRMAYWLMQPVKKNLSAMVTVQERLYRASMQHIFAGTEHVKEVFEMSYGDWDGDHEAVKKFARAVASAIYHARMANEKNQEDPRKAWYDEVTMLRSAPSAKSFIERALILIEQGHREHAGVGTVHRNEDFAPQKLLGSIGNNRSDFETFRDLFRMYLIQESTYRSKEEPVAQVSDMSSENAENEDNKEIETKEE